MKKFIPLIRIISVEHEKTLTAEQYIKAAMEKSGVVYPVKNVFCHLEASRCGISSGKVAIEVDGGIIWVGEALTPALADQFCAGLVTFVRQKAAEYGMDV